MNNFFGKCTRFLKKIWKVYIWLLVVLLMISFIFTVIGESFFPDWVSVILVILYLYLFFTRSKIGATAGSTLFVIFIYVINEISNLGVDGYKASIRNFWNETGYKYIAWAIIIGIIYWIWKSNRKR